MNSRERILAHLDGKPVDHLPLMPITMQFAADMAGAKYRDYVTDYRVLVEGQLRTVEEFGIDYVSAISDPAREAADCGANVTIFDDQPPAFEESNPLLADKSAFENLKAPDPRGGGRMTDRLKALASFRETVGDEKLIEGWIEGPIAEGADLRGINTLMMDFFDDPEFVTRLFEFVTAMEIDFAQAQVEAGADLIGIGDAAASLVGPDLYNEHVWPYEKRMVDAIHDMGAKVRLHICGNTTAIVDSMGRLGADIVDLDFLVDMIAARSQTSPGQVLLGNLDPVRALSRSDPHRIAAELAACHEAAGPRYIVGAGCEVPRETPPENLRALCEYARTHRP